MHDDKIGRGRCNDDHQNRKPDGRPAHGAQALFVGGSGIDVRLIPIAREAGGERVERGAERSHGGGEDSREEQSAKAHWHLIENEVAERFVRRLGQRRIGMGLIVNPEQQPDAEKRERDRDVGEPGEMRERRLRRISFAVNIRCTMSWSVPCVPMVMNAAPIRPAKIV